MIRLSTAMIAAALTLSACANPGLRDLQSNSRGPDEFIIEPNAPLETPPDIAALPTPTPGGGNLTDTDPLADAVLALGGRPDTGGAIPASDSALVASATRFGVTPGIREELAAADAEFRRRQARFTQFRLFPEDLYNRAYRGEALDAERTAERWRRAGVAIPSAPP